VTSLAIAYGYLVAGYATGHLRLFNLETKTLSVEITAHSRAINAIDIHPTLPLVHMPPLCCIHYVTGVVVISTSYRSVV
jgi:hypothetical protein